MMKHFIFSLLTFTLYLLPAFGSNPVRIKITDENSAALSNCNVSIKNECYLLTDNTGCVNIPRNHCHIGDTIQVSYMGYEKRPIVISSLFLQNEREQIYQLTPTVYSLEDVTILGNAEKLFEKKKRNMLLPFLDKHIVQVSANINYTDTNGKRTNTSGNLKVLFKNFDTEIIQNTCTTDSLLQRLIMRALIVGTYAPYDCCVAKIRKLSDIYYLGMQEYKWIFRFDLKPQNLTNKHYGLQKGDELSRIVSVDENGFISRMETRADIKSKEFISYNLLVDYTEHKRKMAPTNIDFTCISEKVHIDLKCTYEP